MVRSNAEGFADLSARLEPGRPPRLSEGERAALAARVFRDPDPGTDGGVSAWTRADLGRWLEDRFGKTFHPSSLSRVLRRVPVHSFETPG